MTTDKLLKTGAYYGGRFEITKRPRPTGLNSWNLAEAYPWTLTKTGVYECGED